MNRYGHALQAARIAGFISSGKLRPPCGFITFSNRFKTTDLSSRVPDMADIQYATPESSPDIAARLQATRQRIEQAAQRYGRDAAEIALVAISKTQPIHLLEQAWQAGQTDFGENYWQDALPKIQALAAQELSWHFVGAIQGNKTRHIAQAFDWAHAVNRLKIARRLSEQRPTQASPLNICIQVNIDREPSKAGVLPEEVMELAARINDLPHIHLRGLMAIPDPKMDFQAQRRPFAALRDLYEQLNEAGHELDTLSMGMSGDLEAAIAEGATMVRVGSAIFGART